MAHIECQFTKCDFRTSIIHQMNHYGNDYLSSNKAHSFTPKQVHEKQPLLLLTSSVKCGIRVFGLKVNSTPHEPPLALSVISVEGLIVRMLACCKATTAGVIAKVNVIGAGLRLTSFKLRWLV